MRFALLPFVLAAPVPLAQITHIEIGPVGGDIKASTYGADSFSIQNNSATARLVEARFNLSTAVFVDLVFDPAGTAGDVVSKPFTPDSGDVATGLTGHSLHLANGGGWDELRIQFNDFDPGETFTFSIDVDPTTIQGSAAPGPGDSGSVSGMELSGSTIELHYEDGTVHSSQVFRLPGSLSASGGDVLAGMPAAPGLEVLGLTTPGQVFTPDWTLRVSGTPGASVRLLQVEGALFTDGIPGGAFDVDPYEANSALSVVEHVAVLDGAGLADIPVTLFASQAEGGLNAFQVTELAPWGAHGEVSPTLTVEYVDVPISFDKRWLGGAGLNLPTSLQFGPDDRLYVAEQAGLIKIFTVDKPASDFTVTATEVIDLVNLIPNHDDDGSVNLSVANRQVTGLLVTGTASDPVIYVTSSDPRIGAGGSGTDKNLDTNSGMVSRLTQVGGAWQKQDLVRGLPRSEENHGPNGMQIDEAAGILYLAQGGHTNMGAISNNFALTPEFALSAAILAIDLNAIGSGTHDLATLDDEDRPGVDDPGDPFGGNDGKNQARLVPGDPVWIHAPGFRNPYDVVVTEAGRMYTVDNGPNAGWGDVPVVSGSSCTNDVHEPGDTYGDGLHFIDGPGYYGGHPNPTRANPLNTFNPTNPQSPITIANPVECEYRQPGAANGAIHVWDSSTNGIAEYRATTFAGSMRGDLLTISLNGQLRRIKPDAAGDGALLVENLFSSVGSGSLDVTAQADDQIFPGTIWVACRTGNSIAIFEPVDTVNCTGLDLAGLDDDFDGFSNADEIDNGTDPCSAGDVPPDADGDKLSDLNDDDDDNDGILDHVDAFAVDGTNGAGQSVPFVLGWETDDGGHGGLLGLGFTGLMTNGIDDYLDLFDPADLTAGGAAGVLTVEKVGPGTAVGGTNDQTYGFQLGFLPPAGGLDFVVGARVVAPFNGTTPTPDQEIGLFLGTGDQSEFVRLVVSGTGIRFGSETGGVTGAPVEDPVAMPGPAVVDLWLEVDATGSTVTPYYQLDAGPATLLGGPQAIPAFWLSGALATGLSSTAGAGTVFAATWDELNLRVPGAAIPYGLGVGGANLGLLDTPDVPTIGGSVDLQVSQMGTGPQALLAFGMAQASIPLLGGTLLIPLPPVADIVPVPLLAGSGNFVIHLPEVLSHVGLVFTCQAAAPDGTQPMGWVLSNGLELRLGN